MALMTFTWFAGMRVPNRSRYSGAKAVMMSLKGVILKSHDYVKELIENTTTLTGLKVKAHITKKIYKTGRKYADNFKETMRIVFDDFLGQWNYRAIPRTA
jgi:Rhodopirellula transposase DDE domain